MKDKKILNKREVIKTFFLIVLFCTFTKNAFADDPLIYANNLEYLGAFRIPVGDFGGPLYKGFSYGGSVTTFNSVNDSLFMVGPNPYVAEISIPSPKIPNSSTDLSNLNYATVIQNFSDITEGNLEGVVIDPASIFGTGAKIGGLLIYNNKLIGSVYTFYDASNAAQFSHFTSGINLSDVGDFNGMFKVGDLGASFYSGWMTKVPATLQSILGGPAVTGNGTLSVISRTSYGPSAFSFDPDKLGVDNPVLATPLLYYPSSHPTLGPDYGNTSRYFNGTTKIAGITTIEGTRSVLFFGYHGIGQYNYGQWATDPIFADTCKAPDTCIVGPKGWPICADMNNCSTGRKGIPYDNDPGCSGAGSDGCYFDPSGMGAKGPHAYPYIYQAWAYDANELALVKSGAKNPWDVMPYAIWSLPFPLAPTDVFGGATAYDPATGRLFIVEPQGDRADQYNRMPLVHVFHVNLGAQVSSGYKIGGKVMLLNGTVILQNNNGDNLTISATDRGVIQNFSFANSVAVGENYNISITAQPVGQICLVINGSGSVDANVDVSNVVVTCENSSDATPPSAPSGLAVM